MIYNFFINKDIIRRKEGDIVIIDPDMSLIPKIEKRLPGQIADQSRIWRLSKNIWSQIHDLFEQKQGVRQSEFSADEFINNIRPVLKQLTI